MQQNDKEQIRDRTLERVCDEAIMNTLKYRSIFKASASFYQIATFLVTDSLFEYTVLKNRTQNLLKGRKIRAKKGKYYYLPGNKPLSWELRDRNTKNLLEHIAHVLKVLEKIKWIKLLAITGSVAAHNAKKNDDIDIFIITEEKRLWLTRAFVFLILRVTDLYPRKDNFRRKICPNIFIDETKMSWDESRRNLFIAHDILMMHPIINRDATYFKFIKANEWVFDYFPNYKIHLPSKIKLVGPYNSGVVDFFEFIAMTLQLWYMKKRKTIEVTTQRFIHFNKYDHTEKVLEEYESLIV